MATSKSRATMTQARRCLSGHILLLCGLLCSTVVCATRSASSGVQLTKRGELECHGYTLQGAGSADYDGCYTQSDQDLYVLDRTHQLYRWQGTWAIGNKGYYEGYRAARPTMCPPLELWMTQNATDPPPTLTRSPSLGPAPAPVPAPAPQHPVAPPSPAVRLVVEDEFSSDTLNTSLWNALQQVHRAGIYDPEHVLVQNGTLILRTVAQNQTLDGVDYYISGGAVNSSGLIQQTHGRFSVRAKLPDVDRTSGYTLHSSIWLFSDASQRGTANISGCPQEIDLIEQYQSASNLTSRVQGNLHPFTGGHGTACNRLPAKNQFAKSADFTTDWHVYTVDWLSDRIVMSIDNETLSVYSNATEVGFFTDPLFIALTSCAMDRVPPTSANVFPQEYLIDWVKIYEWA